MVRVIAVTGGKGGTGKTLLAINLAYAFGKLGRVLLVDGDVDNPCSRTFLKSNPVAREIVREFRPEIRADRCRLCGLCVQNCHPHALLLIPGEQVILMPTLCEGCGVCKLVCPFDAIEDSWIEAGKIEEYYGQNEFDVIIGELKPTTRRTPVMTLKTLRYAEKKLKEYDYLIIDSPPGTGSGVYAIMKLSNLIIAVTEPTKLGLADLTKLYTLYRRMETRRILIALNKAGLRGGIEEEIRKFAEEKGLDLVEIPYDNKVVRAYVKGAILLREYPDSPASKAIQRLVETISGEPAIDPKAV